MNFRVTPRLAIDFATSELGRQAAELQRTQQQISTGIRLHRPSDDPAAVRRSIIQKDQLTRLNTHIESVRHSKSRVSQAHVQLREAQQLYVRAREVALTGAQTTEPAEIKILAAELDGILNQLISIANSSDESGYLFAGTATDTEPFSFDSSSTDGTATYAGTSASSFLRLTGDAEREALIAGDEIFQTVIREPTIILGNTGLSSGLGTDTATGHRTLTVTHTATTFEVGAGVSAGTSSVAGDTIIGASGTNQLQIVDTSGTGASGTVSLNNGASINFTSADTDLTVTGPNGEQVYLDLSAITAGFSGTVDIVADGTLSIDGGITTQPIAFSTNETYTDPADGATVHLDTTTLFRTGEDSAEFVGTNDVFGTLIALRDDLTNSRNLSGPDRKDAINRRLGDIERLEDHLLDEVGTQAVTLEQIERLLVRTEDQTLDQQIKYGETTSAGLAEAAIRMQELLTLQQFTMASVSNLVSQNLLDFLK
ncbi:MAG TPA: flagellar hook-associated protein 3 [Planctomycetes bacterium]|nr:flagellar hook-associated protein 3 [Fuerstiella sp.]HIK94908.1 flagellar hook-associated protein 3 [Planctomycetota bacterium]